MMYLFWYLLPLLCMLNCAVKQLMFASANGYFVFFHFSDKSGNSGDVDPLFWRV
jgi:hypothetical protein